MKVGPRKICLLGGYGDVGLRLAALLHERTPHIIALAGRDGERADGAARSVGARCRGLALDMRGPGALAQLADMDLCVNLTEATPPRLAADLIANGTHFIDSAASPTYVADLRQAIAAVQVPRAIGVLETGVAPGLTNLLAQGMCVAHPEIRSIDILIELGMGTHHGLAATEWTLQALAQSYPMKTGGQWHKTRTGAISRRFTTDTGSVRAIGFAFCDQASIARDLELDGVRTFLALDPGWMTRAVGWLSQGSLGNLLARRSGPVARAMRRMPPMGGSGTRLFVEGHNGHGEAIAARRLMAGPQAGMTASVIAQAVQQALRRGPDLPPGLQALHALLDPASIHDHPFAISGYDL